MFTRIFSHHKQNARLRRRPTPMPRLRWYT
jgi:hypothetical protein